jgi:curli production assembly/transport component CsgG
MRVVAVQTGEVLLTVSGTKTIASHKSGTDVFRFLDLGTKAIEIESGVAMNEPVNYAIRSAIEYCVIEVIQQGADQGLWKMKEETHEKIH